MCLQESHSIIQIYKNIMQNLAQSHRDILVLGVEIHSFFSTENRSANFRIIQPPRPPPTKSSCPPPPPQSEPCTAPRAPSSSTPSPQPASAQTAEKSAEKYITFIKTKMSPRQSSPSSFAQCPAHGPHCPRSAASSRPSTTDSGSAFACRLSAYHVNTKQRTP